jgi:hypothetical protein
MAASGLRAGIPGCEGRESSVVELGWAGHGYGSGFSTMIVGDGCFLKLDVLFFFWVDQIMT